MIKKRSSTSWKVGCVIFGIVILALIMVTRSTICHYVSPEIRGLIEISTQEQDLSNCQARIRIYSEVDIAIVDAKVTREGRFHFEAVQRELFIFPFGNPGFSIDLSILLNGSEVGLQRLAISGGELDTLRPPTITLVKANVELTNGDASVQFVTRTIPGNYLMGISLGEITNMEEVFFENPYVSTIR